MFKENKYTSTYYRIVERARTRVDVQSMVEIHHIIPASIDRSLKTVKDNLVSVTVREHFILHWLLTKMVDNEKDYQRMARALLAMTTLHNGRRTLSSRQIETAKRVYAESRRGRKMPKSHGEKMSAFNKSIGRWQGDNNPSVKLRGTDLHPRKGKASFTHPHTEAAKLKMSENNIMKRDPFAAARVRWAGDAKDVHSSRMRNSNPSSKPIRVTDTSTGDSFVITNLKDFCFEHGWNYKSVWRYKKLNGCFENFAFTDTQ